MKITAYFGALIKQLRTKLTRRILSYRVQARHPDMRCDPTAIWDYAFHELGDLEIGKDVSVGPFAEILVRKTSRHSDVEGKLRLGNTVVISTGCNFRAAGGLIEIGDFSGIGQHVVIVAVNHNVKAGLRYLFMPWDTTKTGVIIGTNVWVGANCTLVAGTRIGDNSVIAAGSVVSGDVPANEIWGGVPARFIRKID